jgi:hypothetical protein
MVVVLVHMVHQAGVLLQLLEAQAVVLESIQEIVDHMALEIEELRPSLLETKEIVVAELGTEILVAQVMLLLLHPHLLLEEVEVVQVLLEVMQLLTVLLYMQVLVV